MTAPQQRLYIDTSVFIWYLHSGKTDGYSKAEKFLEDIASGKYRGVTSNFVRLEYRGFLKEAKATGTGHNASNKELDLLLDELDRLIEDYGIEEVSADYLLNQSQSWIDDCVEIITQCQPVRVGDDWVTMKGADSIHAAIASLAGTQQLATLDNDFRSLAGGITPLILWDVY
jgi:predicted nucleic acid-binding protein